MPNKILVRFESEPAGKNVEYLIRISRFDRKENYCYGGVFESHKTHHRVYIPLTGFAFAAVGTGIHGLLNPSGEIFRRLTYVIMLDNSYGITHKWQVIAAHRDELKPDDCIPEADPEHFSWCAERVWVCKSFDTVLDARRYQKRKRYIQAVMFGANHGH